MTIRIYYSNDYKQDLKILTPNDSELEEEIEKRIRWFKCKPTDERIENHALIGKLKGFWAFSITGDIRILYEWIGKNRARFLAIGGHSKVYTGKAN